jgi:tetratricopeptide (TPR) repeat protein
LAIARESGDRAEIAYCLARLSRAQTDVEPGLAIAQESLAIYEALGDKWGRAGEHHISGYWLSISGQNEAGYQETLKALALYREIGNKSGIAHCLNNMAAALHTWGRWDEAEAMCQEALALHRELANPVRVVWLINTITDFALYRGDFAAAKRLNYEALALVRELGHPSTLANALIASSLLHELAGDDAEAHRLAQAAFACIDVERVPYPNVIVTAYINLAWTLCTQGQYDEATHYLAQILKNPVYITTDLDRMTILPAVARIIAFRGHSLRATELLSLAIMHPLSLRGWAEANPHLLQLRADLEAQLGREAYAAAWERGQNLDLQRTLDELLAEIV